LEEKQGKLCSFICISVQPCLHLFIPNLKVVITIEQTQSSAKEATQSSAKKATNYSE